MSQGRKIVIVGAGPVGLSAAMLLIEAGQRVVVLERERTLPTDMRASTFHPTTLDIIAQYGLAEQLVAQGTVVPKWQYMIHGSDQRAVFDLGVLADVTDHPFRLQCEQFRLTRLIVEKMKNHPNFTIHFGCEVKQVDDNGDSVVVFAEKDGETLFLETPWLIAADGGKSAVRKNLELAFEGSVFPKTSITAVVNFPFQDHIPGLLGVNYVWTESAHYSLMQLRDQWRFSYSPVQSQSVEDALSEESAQAALQQVFPFVDRYDIPVRNYYTLHQRCLESFRVGRVLFAGDSAHLNSPAGGMGMNSGIHDARCLVEHLVPVLEGEDDALLDRYSRRRRTIALDEVQRLSAKNYARHRETDADKRKVIWQELQEIVSDPAKMRDYLLDAAMINSLAREKEIA